MAMGHEDKKRPETAVHMAAFTCTQEGGGPCHVPPLHRVITDKEKGQKQQNHSRKGAVHFAATKQKTVINQHTCHWWGHPGLQQGQEISARGLGCYRDTLSFQVGRYEGVYSKL